MENRESGDTANDEIAVENKLVPYNHCMASANEKRIIQNLKRKYSLHNNKNICVVCLRSFSTYAGFLHHQKRFHLKEFLNNLMEKDLLLQRKKRWTHAEDFHLAGLEASLPISTTTSILNCLASKTNRSRNAIQKRRLRPDHIALVKFLRRKNALKAMALGKANNQANEMENAKKEENCIINKKEKNDNTDESMDDGSDEDSSPVIQQDHLSYHLNSYDVNSEGNRE